MSLTPRPLALGAVLLFLTLVVPGCGTVEVPPAPGSAEARFVGKWKSEIVPFQNDLDKLAFKGSSYEVSLWCAAPADEPDARPVLHGMLTRTEHLQQNVGGALVWVLSDAGSNTTTYPVPDLDVSGSEASGLSDSFTTKGWSWRFQLDGTDSLYITVSQLPTIQDLKLTRQK